MTVRDTCVPNEIVRIGKGVYMQVMELDKHGAMWGLMCAPDGYEHVNPATSGSMLVPTKLTITLNNRPLRKDTSSE